MKTTRSPQGKLLWIFFFTLLIKYSFSLFPPSFSQTFDSFSDGEFLNNPTWVGDTGLFKVNANYQLQLNATAAGFAYLALPVEQMDGTLEWRLNLKFLFAPSANNYAQYYLVSSSTNLLDPHLKGYYLQFGENLSNDAIELFYKSDSLITSVCRGTPAKIANPFDINLKIKLNPPGLWEIFLDEFKTGDYLLDASGVSIHPISQTAIGLLCKFTSSNLNKFYLDNVYFGYTMVDTVPPTVLKVTPSNNGKELIIKYSESITAFSALNRVNYNVDHTFLPDTIYYLSGERDLVKLLFTNPLPSGDHILYIQNISDEEQNVTSSIESPFSVYILKKYDILITEIMADPTPQILLPPSEYIELYNHNAPDTLYLSGWKIQIGSSTKALPDLIIPPQEYVLLVPSSYYEEYKLLYDPVYFVPSLAITNDGQQIILKNDQGEVIHLVDFKISWHTNSLKKDGGWSLELIDPNNPCSGSENWDSSNSNLGGTPTKNNSISDENPDIGIPKIDKITVQDPYSITLYFDEPLSTTQWVDKIKIDKNIVINSVQLIEPICVSCSIQLETPIQESEIYRLSIEDTIVDCVGNMISIGTFVQFGIPEQAEYFDVVINEILTNSIGTTNADFIEIVNRSSKIIDLGTLLIGFGNNSQPEKLISIVSSGYLLFPNQYLAIAKNKKLTIEQYQPSNKKTIIENDSLPNFNNSEGVIYITSKSFQIIDKLYYTESMHAPFLIDLDGVSLEKINYNLTTQHEMHWKSAAQSVGFATPGYKNSQFVSEENDIDFVKIVPAVFSPNGDGFEDIVCFIIENQEDNTRISISIFDIHGNQMLKLVNNQMANPNLIYTWDGTDHRGFKLQSGIYIVKFEFWNLQGKYDSCKRPVSLYRN